MSSITIRDVARKAGVSTATVSRVMNGNGKIRAVLAVDLDRAQLSLLDAAGKTAWSTPSP